ncbi:MAG: DEAD/DEAH box helicase family protein [Oscillospiraceae bacterium]|jgi:superfamily II DNA or RNA helicase|nr:DEAD/DEAH box helicase family protein [Oscillospiraceae bacterium]
MVTNKSSTDEKVALFMGLFRGREDVYAKRWENQRTGKSGYAPVCRNEWVRGLCDKKAHRCAECPHRSFMRLSEKVLYDHLAGKSPIGADVVGIYPLTLDDCCHFLALDFDKSAWKKDVAAFRLACEELELHPAVERSRSGNGAHVWFFFDEKIPAVQARRFGSALLTFAMGKRHEIPFESYDRLFPNQDSVPRGGLGNLIALPLQGKMRKAGNSLFVDDNLEAYPDQWDYLSRVERLSPDDVQEVIRKIGGSELGVLSPDPEDKTPWEAAPPPPPLTPADFPAALEIVHANRLYIPKGGVSERALGRIKRLAAFRNPAWAKAVAMRLPTVGTLPRIVCCADETADYLLLPRGCAQDLCALLDEAHAPYSLLDKRTDGRHVNVTFSGELRPEQTPAAAAMLRHENGVLSATTAFGKTVVGAYLIAQRQVNTLILVHTTALLNQWKKALESFLVFDEPLPIVPRKRPSHIGQLGGGKNALYGKVDIAVMQSLAEGDEVKGLVRDYGMVIVDECHHVSAVSFERILGAVTARHVYGLSATPARSDGLTPIIFMQCGPIRHRVNAAKQAEITGLARFLVPRFTAFQVPLHMNPNDLKIAQLYNALADDPVRNKLIVSDVCAALAEGRTPLVLSKSVAHVHALSTMISAFCDNVIELTGKASAKEKREAVERLQAIPDGEPFCLVATGQFVGEGFDEPRLDTLFLATPIAWKGTLQQYAGRLHRTHPSKSDVMIYDYVDTQVVMLERMYAKRAAGYAAMQYHTREAQNVEKIGTFFDADTYAPVFARDIQGAKKGIVVVAPTLSEAQITQLLPWLTTAKVQGARPVVVTRPVRGEAQTACLQTLRGAGVQVLQKESARGRFCIVDGIIVWYGGGQDGMFMRVENPDMAQELLAPLR